MTRMRVVLVALALLLAVSQFVPWTLAAVIDERRAERPDAVVIDPVATEPAEPTGERDAVYRSPAT
jgi:hypothetical protein